MRHAIASSLCVLLLAFAACADDPEVGVDADAGAANGGGGEIENAYDQLDANGDSFLDEDEVAEWVDQRGEFAEWDADGDSELDRDEIANNVFDLYDGDGDGRITEQEWERAARIHYPEQADVVAFEDLDRDGDSELDVDELGEGFDFSVLGESWSFDSLDEETFKEAYFELYDADEDGRVSQSEWEDAAAGFGTPVE